MSIICYLLSSKMEHITLHRYVLLIECAACGNIHAVSFVNKKDFNGLKCKKDHVSLFTSDKIRDTIFSEFEKDTQTLVA